MTLYLNTNKPLENYTRLVNTENFVDKSMIIEKTNKLINTTNNYLCITRARRFGKSSVIDMLGAYYSKLFDSRFIFLIIIFLKKIKITSWIYEKLRIAIKRA